jgi:hypothetical protein
LGGVWGVRGVCWCLFVRAPPSRLLIVGVPMPGDAGRCQAMPTQFLKTPSNVGPTFWPGLRTKCPFSLHHFPMPGDARSGTSADHRGLPARSRLGAGDGISVRPPPPLPAFTRRRHLWLLLFSPGRCGGAGCSAGRQKVTHPHRSSMDATEFPHRGSWSGQTAALG